MEVEQFSQCSDNGTIWWWFGTAYEIFSSLGEKKVLSVIIEGQIKNIRGKRDWNPTSFLLYFIA